MEKLRKFLKEDPKFLEYIKEDLGSRMATEANINFILEEIVVTHLVRQKLIEFPKTLVKNDDWRLIVYPNSFIKSDFYQFKKEILPNSSNKLKFKSAHYNLKEKKLFEFEKLKVD